MPEMPEVERLVQYLSDEFDLHPSPRPIAKIGYNVARYFNHPEPQVLAFFTNNALTSVFRKGKYIIFHTTHGIWLVHLRFSGWFEIPERPEPLAYMEYAKALQRGSIHLALGFEDGRKWLFWDARTLAHHAIYPDVHDPRRIHPLHNQGPDLLALPCLHPAFAHDGVDPEAWTKAMLAVRSQPLKLALLDQKLCAGVGNIYACEALWHAGLDPRRDSGTVTPAEYRFLFKCLLDTLSIASKQGCIYDTYINVFRKQKCPRCDGPILRAVQQNRGTYLCPACQR